MTRLDGCRVTLIRFLDKPESVQILRLVQAQAVGR